jgi:hypothetical protein
LNLQENPTEPYYACPYCLTKVKTETTPREEEISIDAGFGGEPKTNADEARIKHKDTPSECQFHMGYLSERTSKEQLPDGCLVCKDIVECMLRKMRE